MDPQHARSGQTSRILAVLSSPLSQQASSAQMPFSSVRYSPREAASDEKVDEKALVVHLDNAPRPSCQCASCTSASPSNSARCSSIPSPNTPRQPTPFASTSLAVSSWPAPTPVYTRPRGLRILNLFKAWTPIILYAITTLGFLAAVSWWKVEVFQGLDALSLWLQSDRYTGYAVIFSLIFITTFPPLPLYSTLIILSGYTFGPWTGAILSYWASLTGAISVFLISRTFFRVRIQSWLSCTVTIKRVVRAIEKRPRLLFLIRLAPYPFNVMNCLLAASPSLTFRTYTLCTALSLPKLIIHTTIGSSIRSFADYHIVKPVGEQDEEHPLARYSTIAGVLLCVAIFFYISYISRRAVNDELEDDDTLAGTDSEERVAFLSGEGCDSPDLEAQMVEIPSRA